MCPGCLFTEFLSITFFFFSFQITILALFLQLVFLPRYVTWNEEGRGRAKKSIQFPSFYNTHRRKDITNRSNWNNVTFVGYV